MNLRTPSGTKIIGGLALALIAALGWLFVVSPQNTALGEVRAQIDNTRDQNQVLRLQLVALQAQEKKVTQTAETADALASKFPPTADQPGLFQAVTAAASDAGIGAKDVTALTPTPPVIGGATAGAGVQLPGESTGSDLARQTVTLSVNGTYDQTRQLLANLETMERAYLISSVTVSGGGTETTFTTTITGDMFVMPPAQMRQEATNAPGEPDQ
jgi:hypothetical protein